MGPDFAQNVRMAVTSARDFNAEFCARTRALREARGFNQEDMAEALGIPAYRYRKYEGRTPLPHYLIPRFSLIVGRDIEYIVTGRSSRRSAPRIDPQASRRRKPPPNSD